MSKKLPDYERPEMPFERDAEISSKQARWSAIGIEFAVWVALFLLAGRWLDGKFGWDPWGTAAGGLLGALVGMFMLIRRVLRASGDE